PRLPGQFKGTSRHGCQPHERDTRRELRRSAEVGLLVEGYGQAGDAGGHIHVLGRGTPLLPYAPPFTDMIEPGEVKNKCIRGGNSATRASPAVVAHPQSPSMPPGMPWNTSLTCLTARK